MKYVCTITIAVLLMSLVNLWRLHTDDTATRQLLAAIAQANRDEGLSDVRVSGEQVLFTANCARHGFKIRNSQDGGDLLIKIGDVPYVVLHSGETIDVPKYNGSAVSVVTKRAGLISAGERL